MWARYVPFYLCQRMRSVAICQRTLRIQQKFASAHCACGSNFSSVDGACGSKNKMARISPICKKCKIFYFSPQVPYLQIPHDKKSLEYKRSKSHTWEPQDHITHFSSMTLNFWSASREPCTMCIVQHVLFNISETIGCNNTLD